MRIINALHWAVIDANINQVKELIVARININEKDSVGDTALHHACRGSYRNEKLQIVKILLAAGADVNAENNIGRSPLHEARNKECIEILIAAGADIDKSDKNGWTLLRFANEFGWLDIVEMLNNISKNETSIKKGMQHE